jgi:hypothetical protein
MQILVDWGSETPEEIKKRKRREEEEEFERFVQLKMRMMQEARQLQDQTQTQATVVSGLGGGGGSLTDEPDQLFVYKDPESLTWKYAIINYSDASINGPYETSVVSADFYVQATYIIQNKGFVLNFVNNVDSVIHTVKFISSDGTIKGSIDNLVTLDYGIVECDGRFVVASDADAGIIWFFDGDNFVTYTDLLPGTGYFVIGSFVDLTNTKGVGVFTLTPVGEDALLKYWLIGSTGVTLIFESEPFNPSIDPYQVPILYNKSDKILTFTYDNNTGKYYGFAFYDSSGNILQDVTFPESTLYTSIERFLYGTDKYILIAKNDADTGVDYLVYQYDGVTNTLQSLTLSRTEYTSFSFMGDYVSQSTFNEWTYSEHAALTFYTEDSNYHDLTVVTACEIVYFFAGQTFETYTPVMPYGRINTGTNWNKDNFYFLFDDGDDALKVLTISSNPENRIIETDLQMITSDLYSWSSGGGDTFLVLKLGNVNTSNNTIMHYLNSETQTLLTQVIEEPYNLVGYTFANGPIVAVTNTAEWYVNWNSTEWTESSKFYKSRTIIETFGQRYYTDSQAAPGVILETGGERLFWFNDSPVDLANTISDGGYNMFDVGNILTTNIYGTPLDGGGIPYTHTQTSIDDHLEARIEEIKMDGQVANGDSYLGDGSTYFTNLYPGFFVLSADHIDITSFTNSGNYGSNSASTYELGTIGPIFQNGTTYTAFYKKESDDSNYDPSITHIVIVNVDSVGLINEETGSNDNYVHTVSDIREASRLDFLLFAKRNNVSTLEEITNFVENYLATIDPDGTEYTLDNALARLNLNYGTVTNSLPSHDSIRFITGTSTSTAMVSPGFDRSDDQTAWLMSKDYVALIFVDYRRNGLPTLELYLRAILAYKPLTLLKTLRQLTQLNTMEKLGIRCCMQFGPTHSLEL